MPDPRESERGEAEGAGDRSGESVTQPNGAPAPAPLHDLVAVARVRKAHGVRGELVVEALTTSPKTVLAIGRRLYAGTPDGQPLGAGAGRRGAPREVTVRQLSPFKGGWIIGLTTIDDRNEAELWRARTLLAPAPELPDAAEDEVHYHDLVGLTVTLESGEVVGEVVELYELPQGLMLDVRRAPPASGTVMLAYRPDVVREVDLARRVAVVTPPEGLLE
jgi:16S rRNA processing protein RimM